ncbi:hypothetical protein R1sor_018356 [Riccia sorocarpa]|uniref:Uncharacterized protein n=1 Tax=Riccia sorocarpa TaxID=122646 RepID=A0ABD3ICR6_9MARC
MAPGLSWKMFVGPGLLMGLKFANVDYQKPENLIFVRAFYAISQLFLFGICAFIALGIRNRGDDKKTLKLVTPPSPMSPGEEPRETEVTFKAYDMEELQKLVKNFIMGAAITVGIHVYMQVVPALLLQIVTQPITLIDHPLFALYILNKDPAQDSKLKRPFPDNSPTGRIAAMKEAQKQQELQGQENQSSTQALADGGSTSETASDTAVGGNAQISVTTAGRRSARPERLPCRVAEDEMGCLSEMVAKCLPAFCHLVIGVLRERSSRN